MANLLMIVVALALIYLTWHFQCLFTNYRAARRSGFPVLVIPFNVVNPVYILLGATLRPLFEKIVAPLLNESISKAVWNEASSQANALLTSLTDVQSAKGNVGQTDATMAGIRSIAIKVIGSVIYGTQSSWQEGTTEAPKGYRLTYMDVILEVIEKLFIAVFVPTKVLTSPIMPKSIQRVGYAVEEYPRHVQQILESERDTGHASRKNLLSTLIAASDAESARNTGASKSRMYLSDKELAGNFFQFTVAGFDTTANTMAYAVTLLALYPEWQDWIREEINEVMHDKSLEYEAAYPVLKRCLALMFEVLRLYTPIAHIPRSTASAQQLPNPSGPAYNVSANTTVYISGACLHVSSAIWGKDALGFRPSRWLSPEGDFVEHPRSSFIPWSTGPRLCPGMKMAEVEFVAVMMSIFRTWKVAPAVLQGETTELASERLRKVVADSHPRLTLQMNRPKDVLLRWTRHEN
ncbi:uncharacterized protein KY384_007264 [Bacidia gigantensis]|uniref:uncharacterized protein n=1 Tax=Bacidia gigantensis TaxID=2732470 RepID=UPI001D04F5BD|nr:uncharacterized protein KY384_007264 [Bacidia gigantensis]KAG8528346.1 hypothetical protein KY384_007264 [Bacidia gigantensis]